MKAITTNLGLLLVVSALCWGQPALIAHTAWNATPTSPAVNTTGATLLCVVISSNGNNVTVSDNMGNIWTNIGAEFTGDAGTTLFCSTNPKVGPGHTFTYGGSPSAVTAAAATAFSGVISSDGNSGNTANGTSVQPGSITPSQNNEVLIMGLGADGNNNTYSIDSGFTISDQMAVVPGVSLGVMMAYLVQGTAAAMNPTVSWSSPTRLGVIMASFKAATPTPPTPTPPTTSGTYSPCDLNQDGVVNSADVNIAVNWVLTPPSLCPVTITGAGSCNAAVVQRVIAASLPGGTCHPAVLNWTASTSSTVAGYNVYRSTTSASGYTRLNSSPISGTTYTDGTSQPGQTYYYVVTSVDSSGNESAYSNPPTVAAITSP